MSSQEYNIQKPYLSVCAVHRVPLHKSTKIPASKSTSTSTKRLSLFQFCTIVDQNRNFDFGSFNYTYMYQLIEKVVRNKQNFTVFQSPLDLSIILFLELKCLVKFCQRHHQFHHIGHFNQYCIVCTLHFTGNYIDDNAQTDTRS